MTRQEYETLTRQARDSVTTLTSDVMKKQAKIYQKAAKDLASTVKTLPAQLSPSDLYNIKMMQALDTLSSTITESISDNVLDGVKRTSTLVSNVDKYHMYTVGLDKTQVANIVQTVNEDVVAATINRVYQDGYTFSQRLWIEGQKTQNNIKDILNAGISQGRDPFKIAKDIQVYTKDGKKILLKRYRKLKAGTKEFIDRIPENVDYRAMRIVRTEMYNSMRDAEVRSAASNPGTTGLFDWIRQTVEDYGCTCPDLAAGSPYTREQVPSNPHPNCSCRIQARLRNQTDYVNDLAAWANGADIDYLDEWAADYGYVK